MALVVDSQIVGLRGKGTGACGLGCAYTASTDKQNEILIVFVN